MWQGSCTILQRPRCPRVKENGVTLGRPRSTPDDVVARVAREGKEGKTAYAIARDPNRDAVPTAQGARAWSQATVRAMLMRKCAN